MIWYNVHIFLHDNFLHHISSLNIINIHHEVRHDIYFFWWCLLPQSSSGVIVPNIPGFFFDKSQLTDRQSSCFVIWLSYSQFLEMKKSRNQRSQRRGLLEENFGEFCWNWKHPRMTTGKNGKLILCYESPDFAKFEVYWIWIQLISLETQCLRFHGVPF